MNVATFLHRAAARDPQREAVSQGADALTYRELADRVGRLAACLRARGLARGDRVGLIQFNGMPFLETLLAAFHGGLIAVPVNARDSPEEAAAILADADVSAIVYGSEHADRAAAGREEVEALTICVADDPAADLSFADALSEATGPMPMEPMAMDEVAWLFYTSGTTGRSKGAMLTHGSLLTMTVAYLADLRSLGGRDVVLHAAPLSHGSGLYALPALARRTAQVLTSSRSYDPGEILGLIGERTVSDISFLSPTMLKWLVEAQRDRARDLGNLRHITYGGGPMYRTDLETAVATLGPVIGQVYGQAESPMTITCLQQAAHEPENDRLLSSAGWPFSCVEIAIADEDGAISDRGAGEIVTRGPVLMAGYWRNKEATAAAIRSGWLHTGDVGRIDDDGLVSLQDRSKDLIITGGSNVYPREVEDLILAYPGVGQVAVLGVPDDDWGEQVVAVIVIEPGGPSPETLESELDTMCRQRLAGYKRPRRYEWRDELPLNAYGKVLKRDLRAEFWRYRERRI